LAKKTSRSIEIEKKALELLETHSMLECPVDIENLVTKLNIKLSFEELEDEVSGFLLTKNGKQAIVINSSHHECRKRFSIAHELGHSVLHDKDRELFLDSKKTVYFFRDKNSSSGINTVEIEANEFAAQVLMPKKLIDQLIKKYALDLTNDDDLTLLSKKLKVSEQALTFRLVRLNYIGIE
jgi:Zn-dependent peptidase ImmA (M78 family)